MKGFSVWLDAKNGKTKPPRAIVERCSEAWRRTSDGTDSSIENAETNPLKGNLGSL
jgi:hypothetical protein